MKFTVPFLAALPVVLAANATIRSTFIYNSSDLSTKGNGFIWSMNVVKSTGDVYFHLEGPASGSWIGVGFGEKMPGSLMILGYPSANSSGITISPRIGNTRSEPTYDKSIKIEQVWDSGLVTPNSINKDKNAMYVDGVCRGCVKWNGGSLDLSNQKAKFIFATGPDTDMNSDDPAAPLKRHNFYGNFELNLPSATSEKDGAVPTPFGDSYKNGSLRSTYSKRDSNAGPAAHAAVMCISWLILFPLGSIILRLFNKVILHAIVQVLGFVFVLVGFCLGIYIGTQYNRSKKFQSAHQIIGLVLMLGLLVQLGLGIIGHRFFKKYNKPAAYAKVHLILGPLLIVVAIVNGGIGWGFALNPWMNMKYAIAVVAIFLVFLALRAMTCLCTRRRKKNKADPDTIQGQDGYQYPSFTPPKQPYANVAMQPYPSSDSVPQYQPPQYTRPMV